jgi:predicted dehydrogenase
MKRAGLTAAGLAASQVAFPTRAATHNDTIQIGVLGTGGRARQLMRVLSKIDKVKITGVCDIYEAHLGSGKELADAGYSRPKVRKLLERKDVDAVLIGAPDHWHVKMTIDACQAGKDVYVEKPLTHSRDDGQSVVRRRSPQSRGQVGTNGARAAISEARRIIQGKLGKIEGASPWNRNFCLSETCAGHPPC